MPSGNGVFASPLIVLVPFKTVRSEFCSADGGKNTNDGDTNVRVLPGAMVAVATPLPERPLTLQVKSLEVTSVTGLLLGGTRI